MTPAERETYRLQAKLASHKRVVSSSMATIRSALDIHPGVWAVCCSGGKDSTAMLSVAIDAGWTGPIFHLWYSETPPENTEVVFFLAERFGLRVDSLKVPGAWDVYEECGRFFTCAETDRERKSVRDMLRGYKSSAAAFTKEMGYCGIMMGLRREESRCRSIIAAKKGSIYTVKDRPTTTCCPMLNWSSRDIWARHVSHDLPWLARYDLSDDRERERSETTWLASETIWRHGQAQRMRRYDPELWSRLVLRWPELSRMS